MIGLEYYSPTEKQIKHMGEIAFASRCKKLIYKKVDTGYLAYHPYCNRKGTIDENTLKQTRRTHLCPFCFSNIDSTTKETHHNGYNFVEIEKGKESFGYYVEYEFELGKEMYSDCDQVLYASGNDCYHRYIKLSIFANSLSFRPDLFDWKYSKRSNFSSYTYSTRFSYEQNMLSYEYNRKRDTFSSKKEYLEENAPFITKSNQKKLVMDNLFSPNEMKLIKVFDLKKFDEVIGHSKFIKENEWHFHEYLRDGIELNKYYLDYLERNNISMGTYYAYMNTTKQLGFKLDKPTDFKYRYNKVLEMAEQKKDEALEEKIAKRYEELPKYECENVTISPFKNAKEIRDCGKKLHNCIGGYVKNYAEKNKDIYHLDLDGALTIAIEITNNDLKQAYSDSNKKCPDNLLNHIKTFCNANGFTLGKYA